MQLNEFPMFPTGSAKVKTLAERPLTEWPVNETPEARMNYGVDHMKDSDLLTALFQGTGNNGVAVAQSLLADYGLKRLARMSVQELAALPGMTNRRARLLAAALELGKRGSVLTKDDVNQIRSPADAAKLLMNLIGSKDQEHFVVLALNTKNEVIAITTVYIGQVDGVSIRAGEVFKEAVRLNARSIMIAHNHPSGNSEPSSADLIVTRSLNEAARIMDIELLDHLVIGHGCYKSLRESYAAQAGF